MKTINTSDISYEEKILNSILSGEYCIHQKVQEELNRVGYQLIDLGTGPNQYTTSKEIKIHQAPNGDQYFGVGFHNRGTSKNGIRLSVYRAWVKKLQP